uniref:C2H2-type domain-containing protein n=1 Tax=Macrostomum lignano TaxID=282301 RepID=A0A1I8JIR1_9PLAT
RCTHDLYSSCACCKWVSLGQPARHCPGSACYCTHDLYSSCACCKWVSLGHFTCTNSTEYHLTRRHCSVISCTIATVARGATESDGHVLCFQCRQSMLGCNINERTIV